MKKIIYNLKKECGFDKLTLGQSLILMWSILAFCLMACCNYEESAWYAMPVLVGHFALSAFLAKKIIPKSYWDTIDNDTEI